MIPIRQVWPDDLAERYRQAGYWRGETFGSFLRERARELGPHTAVVSAEGERWSYQELDRRVDGVAAGFLAAGLKPGDRVIVQLPNVPEFFSVALGLLRAGILPVYALPAHRKSEIIHFAEAAEAGGYVVVDEHAGFDYRTLAAEVAASVPGLTTFVVGNDPGPWIPYAELESAEPLDLPDPPASAPAFLQLSGGSTGLSKLIPRTHDDYIYTLRESARICGLDRSSVYLGTLPIAHNYPMSSPGVFGTLYAGGTSVLTTSPSPDVAFPIIERERVTITGVVPPVALVWIQAARTTTCDLSSLRMIQVGGARLLSEVARQVEPALGARLQQVFGMAEGLVCYTRMDDPDEVVLDTQGRPISPDDEILIVDDDGVAVEEGRPGHLLTRGPYTIRGYHNAGDANERAFTDDGFYRTGDIVARTPEGNLVVHGRATDVINRGGEKVPPEEVENHLLAHERVHDAAVVGIPDPYMGERACAVLIARGEAPSVGEIRSWLVGRGLAAYKIPDRVTFVDAFPSTGVGKVSRRDLRRLLRERLTASEADV